MNYYSGWSFTMKQCLSLGFHRQILSCNYILYSSIKPVDRTAESYRLKRPIRLTDLWVEFLFNESVNGILIEFISLMAIICSLQQFDLYLNLSRKLDG